MTLQQNFDMTALHSGSSARRSLGPVVRRRSLRSCPTEEHQTHTSSCYPFENETSTRTAPANERFYVFCLSARQQFARASGSCLGRVRLALLLVPVLDTAPWVGWERLAARYCVVGWDPTTIFFGLKENSIAFNKKIKPV
mmetsp:Transcript_10256/g.21588  ORF Transcript_10256/g.21588 Transcript_10256/m.21588 type:complete len:140 (+) Transcript_10256:684-1103(+)